jgi:hypothetical protein
MFFNPLSVATKIGKKVAGNILPKAISDKLIFILDLLKDSQSLKDKIVGTPPFFTDGKIISFCMKDGILSNSVFFCTNIAMDIISVAVSGGAAAPKLIKTITSDPEQVILFMTEAIIPAIIEEAEEGRTSYLITMNAGLSLIFGPGITVHQLQTMTLDKIINQFNIFQGNTETQPVIIPQQPVMIPQQPVMIPQQPVMIPQQPIIQGGKKIRKHRGIHQTGKKAGKLKKGYKYSGKRLKNGKAQIIKVKKSKK